MPGHAACRVRLAWGRPGSSPGFSVQLSPGILVTFRSDPPSRSGLQDGEGVGDLLLYREEGDRCGTARFPDRPTPAVSATSARRRSPSPPSVAPAGRCTSRPDGEDLCVTSGPEPGVRAADSTIAPLWAWIGAGGGAGSESSRTTTPSPSPPRGHGTDGSSCLGPRSDSRSPCLDPRKTRRRHAYLSELLTRYGEARLAPRLQPGEQAVDRLPGRAALHETRQYVGRILEVFVPKPKTCRAKDQATTLRTEEGPGPDPGPKPFLSAARP